MTGLELKLKRVGARVTGRRLASEMGVSSSRISAIEREAQPTPEITKRYLSALETLSNVPHVGEAA